MELELAPIFLYYTILWRVSCKLLRYHVQIICLKRKISVNVYNSFISLLHV